MTCRIKAHQTSQFGSNMAWTPILSARPPHSFLQTNSSLVHWSAPVAVINSAVLLRKMWPCGTRPILVQYAITRGGIINSWELQAHVATTHALLIVVELQIPLVFRLSRVHRRTDRLHLCEYLYSLQRPSTPELLLPPVILTAYSPFQV